MNILLVSITTVNVIWTHVYTNAAAVEDWGKLFSVCQFKIKLHIEMAKVKVKALYQITVKMIYIKVKGQIFCKNDFVLVSDVDSETHQYPV